MSRVYLVDKDHALASPGRFVTADEALRHLRSAALDHDNLQHFRRVWRDQTKGGGALPATDRSVLSYLAERLATGTLRLAGKRKPPPDPARRPTGGGTTRPAEPPVEMVPAASSTPALKLRPAAPPAAPKLPDPIADFAQQAQCLVDAAAAGLPFCEQCAKP